MASGPTDRLSFLHLADLRFARALPLQPDMPPQLRELLLTAKRISLQNALCRARDRGAQFVILTGKILGAKRFPPGVLWTLLEDLGQAAKQGLPVFWAFEEGRFPAWATPPGDVQLLRQPIALKTTGAIEKVRLVPLKVWASRMDSSPCPAAGKLRNPPGVLTIVAGHFPGGEALRQLMEKHPATYWALGGLARHTIKHGGQVAHLPGPLQAERPWQFGPQAGTLVSLSPSRPPQLEPLSTDQVRFVQLHLDLRQSCGGQEFLEQAAAKVARLRKAWPTPVILARWVIHVRPQSNLGCPEAGIHLEENWRRELNRVFAQEHPAFWSLEVKICGHGLKQQAEAHPFAGLVLQELKSPAHWQQAALQLSGQAQRILGQGQLLARVSSHLGRKGVQKLLARTAAWQAWQLLQPGGEGA
ncbi:MAG: hypothetical protein NZ899_10870 [Thermoguttaceae bacterium]|nr:hypothetical protein [Thermoguttaceae bacterium]MDW8079174.1 hypothetical protein [Thermoguttaceae bacterium]